MRLLLLILLFPSFAFAQDRENAFRATDLPLPRFVSVGAGEAYVRAGPGRKYPVRWVFKQKGLPVEIILEFDHWRKIRDMDGDEGWLHKSLLSGRRTAIIDTEENATLYQKPALDARIAAYLQPNVLLILRECENEWCAIDASGYKGWVRKENLWGVYPDEILEK